MVTLKISTAAAILAGTAAIGAGASYVVTKTTTQAVVAANCPMPSTPSSPVSVTAHPFPPLGNVPSTTDGKQW